MDVILQKNAVDTQAVVIMFGWYNSAPKHVKKYAELYSNQPQNKCAVVYGSLMTSAFITRNHTLLYSFVMEAVRKAVEIIKHVESENSRTGGAAAEKKVPVILHYFSNGGAFAVEKFGIMMKDAIAGNLAERQDAEDLKTINSRLKTKGFEVLDSAPGYLKNLLRLAFATINTSIPFLPLKLVVMFLVSISAILMILAKFLVPGREALKTIFWNNMLESDVCQRQAFIYSSVDKLANGDKIDEFVEARKKKGIDVTVLKFDDSEHCMHMKAHPTEYKEKIVDHVLETVCNCQP